MSQQPSSPHSARYRPAPGAGGDARLRSPVFLRNGPALVAALTPWLGNRHGPVLEIGSGTGQHATSFTAAFPRLSWQASDPDAQHRRSVAAWGAQAGLAVAPALDLDAARDWAMLPAIQTLGPLTGVVAMNVIHIAPIDVARGIIAGAGRTLARDGLLIFYGPFKRSGRSLNPGNAAFDAGLRADNPAWGLRDTGMLEDLADEAGLGLAALIAMPADNHLLIFTKR